MRTKYDKCPAHTGREWNTERKTERESETEANVSDGEKPLSDRQTERMCGLLERWP